MAPLMINKPFRASVETAIFQCSFSVLNRIDVVEVLGLMQNPTSVTRERNRQKCVYTVNFMIDMDGKTSLRLNNQKVGSTFE